jgi:hypothetical protein
VGWFGGGAGFVGGRGGQVRLYGEEIVDGTALFLVEAVVELGRVEGGLALGLRELTQQAKGAGDCFAAAWRQRLKLTGCCRDLLQVLGRHVLHLLVEGEAAITLGLRQAVEAGKIVANLLLGLGRKVAEAGLIRESLLLLLWSEVAVILHPLSEMLLVVGADLLAGLLTCLLSGTDRLLARRWGCSLLEATHAGSCMGGRDSGYAHDYHQRKSAGDAKKPGFRPQLHF